MKGIERSPHTSLFLIGEEVMIHAGPLQGLRGIIQNPKKAKERVKVLLELLGRPIEIEVPSTDVTARWRLPIRAVTLRR